MILGGPAAAGWVAADRHDRAARAPRADSLVRNARQPCWHRAAAFGGRLRWRRFGAVDRIPICRASSRRWLGRRSVISLNVVLTRPALVSLCERRRASGSCSSATSRGIAVSLFALAPLAWLMAEIYTPPWRLGLGDPAVRPAAVHDPRSRTSASSRCARCSRRPSGRSPRRSTSAIRTPSKHAAG